METALIGEASVTDILRKDRDAIRDLFQQVEDAASDRRKKIIGDRCLREIEIHAFLENRIFYPAVRRDLGEDRLVAQALEEHEAERRIVDKLKELPAGEGYNALFRELRELVVFRFVEEESELLALVEKSDMDVEQLGAHLLEKKRRIEPSRFEGADLRDVAAFAAGVALAGAAAWLVSRRLSGGRRART